MDQNEAFVGQEAMPENNQTKETQPEEHPSERPTDMESLLRQEGLGLEDFLPKQGEIRNGTIAGIGPNEILVSIGTKSEGVISGREKELIPTEELRSFYVGKEIPVYVIDPEDRERRRLILSERAAIQETRETLKDRLLEELQEGAVRVGRVTSLADFGAFVNIDGADGLVHLSEITWDRIQHPNEVLKVGQEVKVKVISMDRERKRIGLSIRQLLPDPWMKKVEGFREGQLVEGTITHLTKFGAFARIGEDLEGLVHVSELSEQRIAHPKEVLKEGDVVTLRVIKIDPERRRIGLSLRKVDSPAYADLDWKMALAEEISEVHPTEPATQPELPESGGVTVSGDSEPEDQAVAVETAKGQHPEE